MCVCVCGRGGGDAEVLRDWEVQQDFFSLKLMSEVNHLELEMLLYFFWLERFWQKVICGVFHD